VDLLFVGGIEKVGSELGIKEGMDEGGVEVLITEADVVEVWTG
jgi:hypothetical protein